MGEVLIQIWYEEFEKTSRVLTQAPASPQKKCAMKMKEKRKRKNDYHVKNFVVSGKTL